MRACVIKPVATSAPRLSRRRINEGGWESPGRNARGRDSGKETGMVVRVCVCVLYRVGRGGCGTTKGDSEGGGGLMRIRARTPAEPCGS